MLVMVSVSADATCWIPLIGVIVCERPMYRRVVGSGSLVVRGDTTAASDGISPGPLGRTLLHKGIYLSLTSDKLVMKQGWLPCKSHFGIVSQSGSEEEMSLDIM